MQNLFLGNESHDTLPRVSSRGGSAQRDDERVESELCGSQHSHGSHGFHRSGMISAMTAAVESRRNENVNQDFGPVKIQNRKKDMSHSDSKQGISY